MEIKGKVHCFFEQSGAFKNEFIKLGIPAEDYDIQNNFGETDHTDDLFKAIEEAYDDKPSLFDNITPDDLVMAFFPCIHFCDAKVMMFKEYHISMKKWSLSKIMKRNIDAENDRHEYFIMLMKLVCICDNRHLRIIIENPWNTSGMTYLQNNFPDPTIIDKNRALRGDYYVKPTAYWFFGCTNTIGHSYQPNCRPKIVYKEHSNKQVTGQCDEQRSLISSDYARNFICDFVIGKAQQYSEPSLFD